MNALLLGTLLLVLAVPSSDRRAAHDSARTSGAADLSPMGEFDLAQRHYARGEYRQAAEHFTLAAARLDPAQKPTARYWTGLSWLGAGETTQARAAFEDVIDASGIEVPMARLGIALCWEAEHRPDRAEETLARLVPSEMGEAGPAALAHLATLAHARGDLDRERRAHERLVREYPASMEAAEVRVEVARAPAALGAVWVQIGAFSTPENARALVAAARHAGLGDCTVRKGADASQGLNVVLLGPFRTEDEARRAAAQASERLGVAARLARTP